MHHVLTFGVGSEVLTDQGLQILLVEIPSDHQDDLQANPIAKSCKQMKKFNYVKTLTCKHSYPKLQLCE